MNVGVGESLVPTETHPQQENEPSGERMVTAVGGDGHHHRDGDEGDQEGGRITDELALDQQAPTAIDDPEQPLADVLVIGDALLPLEEQHDEEEEEEDGEGDNAFPLWLRRSLPSSDWVAVVAYGEGQHTVWIRPPQDPEGDATVCQECGKRHAVFSCSDCDQRLCFKCCDAIHIIPSLATHSLQLLPEPEPVESPPPGNDASVPPISAPPSPRAPAPPPPVLSGFAPATTIEHRLHLPVGTPLFFRADDIDANSRALRHGIIIGQDHGVRANTNTTTTNTDTMAFYYRVVWLRGVEALANGFFRASLVLPAPHWPVEIGLFPSQLGAFRAVLTAEKLARGALRRDRVGGRTLTNFPTDTDTDEIKLATESVLGFEFRNRLTPQDDKRFWQELSAGGWSYSDWLQRIARSADLAEEGVAVQELADATVSNADTHELALLQCWAPTNRVRFFLIEQSELLLPHAVQRSHVMKIIHQLLFTYTGFAWQRWRQFVKRHRSKEKLARRHAAADSIVWWWRRLHQRRLANTPTSVSADAFDLYRRRQLCASKLFVFFEAQWLAQLRRAFQRWAEHHERSGEPSENKMQRQWHPSHGILGLPRLPKPFAHRSVNGSVAIEDLTRYQQFRAAHAGPTEASYWVIRDRVLAGEYPSGLGAFRRSPRRMVSRADDVTSILLQQVGSFVCLAEPTELARHEPTIIDTTWLATAQTQYQRKGQTLVDDTVCVTPWLFERIVRAKHELVRVELAAAVKLQDRLEQLAQRQLDDGGADANREALENKLTLAQQGARAARSSLQQLAPLDFEVMPIPKDSVPSEDTVLEAYLVKLEAKLRRGERVFVFSVHGHGRTGLIAALLLARLYGITASDALERAQRLHDCQWLMHGVGATHLVSSPHAFPQVAAVQRLVARSTDAVYARIETDSVDDRLVSWRAQQRGQPIEKYATQAGFMVSDRVDDATQRAQREELAQLQRIAKRETAATKLQFTRRRERRVREAMEREDRR